LHAQLDDSGEQPLSLRFCRWHRAESRLTSESMVAGKLFFLADQGGLGANVNSPPSIEKNPTRESLAGHYA
jgi:hypothetical protein